MGSLFSIFSRSNPDSTDIAASPPPVTSGGDSFEPTLCESNTSPCYPGPPVNFGGPAPCRWNGQPDCTKQIRPGVPCCDVESDRVIKDGGSCTEGANLNFVFGFSGKAGVKLNGGK